MPYPTIGRPLPRAAEAHTALVATAWHYADEYAAPRLVTAYPTTQDEAMAPVREIAAFDRVELIEPVDDAPAGARGGVLELRDGDTAMVEIVTPVLDPAARTIFVPLDKLRRVA
jgi:hypothetical protein